MNKKIIVARYINVNDVGIAIVASIFEGVDWAAYIGAYVSGASGNSEISRDDTVNYVVKYGNKLSEEDARYYFPDIYIKYRK